MILFVIYYLVKYTYKYDFNGGEVILQIKFSYTTNQNIYN